MEVLFSPGANYNPFEVLPPHHSSHVLPTIPRTALHKGEGITLAEMEEKLLPFSQVGPGWTWAGSQAEAAMHMDSTAFGRVESIGRASFARTP